MPDPTKLLRKTLCVPALLLKPRLASPGHAVPCRTPACRAGPHGATPQTFLRCSRSRFLKLHDRELSEASAPFRSEVADADPASCLFEHASQKVTRFTGGEVIFDKQLKFELPFWQLRTGAQDALTLHYGTAGIDDIAFRVERNVLRLDHHASGDEWRQRLLVDLVDCGDPEHGGLDVVAGEHQRAFVRQPIATCLCFLIRRGDRPGILILFDGT